MRTEDVAGVEQCSAEQRAANRAFRRSLRQECKAERTWGEEFATSIEEDSGHDHRFPSAAIEAGDAYGLNGGFGG